MSDTTAKGSCLCGGVSFTVSAPLRPVTNCHCEQCRRTHGHVAAYTAAPTASIHFTERRGLKWYVSSDTARRGFCQECGGSLFFEPTGKAYTAIAAGMLDTPTGLTSDAHIFVAHKGDYYEIGEDGLPRYDDGMLGKRDDSTGGVTPK